MPLFLSDNLLMIRTEPYKLKYNVLCMIAYSWDIYFAYCSWHEIGTRDLPAMIDRIVETTGQEKLLYLGHRQGTAAFSLCVCVMAS